MPTIPMSATSAPASAAPSITAAAIAGDESAHVAADGDRAGLNCSTYARPIA